MRKKWNFIFAFVVAAFLCTALILGARFASGVVDAFIITKI